MNSDSLRPNKWFVCPRPNPGAKTRLFLFPYAGGGPAVFNKWISGISGTTEAWIAHYPGRGSRHHETPIKEINTLVEHLFLAIQPLLDKPFALFGHSLGGLLAFELARHLGRNTSVQPQALFVSGCGAPHLADPHLPIHTLPDDEFLQRLEEFKGIPSELLDQPEAMQLFLPILRADFEAIEDHVYSPALLRLDIPIIAFGGLADPRLSRERLEGWASHTSSGFQSQYFAGDHFFIHTARDAVITAIAASLGAIHEKN